MSNKKRRVLGSLPLALLVAIAAPGSASAAGPITYDDISLDGTRGLSWRRAPSATKGNWDAVKIKPFMAIKELNETPLKWRGNPGVAILDYDNDGDLDVYVTNGPGRANSLFKNLFAETGQLKFVDVAVQAGIDATSQDSTGVCFGDIDNDGDEDVYVLGRMEPNRLFRNDGNGRFTDITTRANAGAASLGHTSCAMGDIDNDGYLDIFVANTFDMARQDAIYTDYFSFNHANQLLKNDGNGRFVDVSSRVAKLQNVPPGAATISWATALVDYDQDGDVDIFHADDQAAMAPALLAGVDRGYIQVHKNDGRGGMTNVTAAAGLTRAAQWMGLAFGDLNGDGILDVFATSVGDYLPAQQGFPIPPGIPTSRWFLGLGTASGSFTEPGVGALVASPFGWGTGIVDYDNDGDQDIVFYGNLDVGPFNTADNPGVILANDGNANFTWDRNATLRNAERVLRSDVQGVALGDLNGDGFVDIVHAAGGYAPTTIPLVKMNQQWGSPFDATAYHLPLFYPIGPMEYEWAGTETEEGILGVEISSGNENNWVKVLTRGTKDLTSRGKVNRDGIGAVVKFTPAGGKPQLGPVLGGSSHASQHALVQSFGLGAKTSGVVEILWPGGTKNRLYDVQAGETVTFPEVPCSYAATWPNGKGEYTSCVNGAVDQLYFRDVIDQRMASRLRASASRAYDESH